MGDIVLAPAPLLSVTYKVKRVSGNGTAENTHLPYEATEIFETNGNNDGDVERWKM